MSDLSHKKLSNDLRIKERAIAASINAIVFTDLEGTITYVNNAFLKTWGYDDAREVLGRPAGAFWQVEGDAPRVLAIVLERESYRGELVAKRKDGSALHVQLSAGMVRDENERPVCLMDTFIDITEHKNAEEELRKSENKYRTLLENLPQKIFFKDVHSVYVSCNENYAKDLKISPDEILGKTDYDFYSREIADKYKVNDERVIETGETEAFEEKYVQKGREQIVQTVKTPIRDEKGNNLGILGIFWDVTGRKKAEEAKAIIEERLKDKVTELSIMNEIGEVLLSTRELDEILHMILIGATAYQALGFNRAFLFLINEEETMLEGEVATGSLRAEEAYKIWERMAHESKPLKELLKSRQGELSQEDEPINNLVKQIKIPLLGADNIFSRAVAEKRSFNIINGVNNPLFDKDFITLLGTDSFALVPLVSRGKPLGLLLADNFINREPIDDEAVERLRAFANHASLAIENAHLYKILEEKIEELSCAYNELQENRNKLIRYERLSAVGNVAARVTHEIRNPLVAIGGFARRILKKDHTQEVNRNYVNIIVEEIDRLENILTDILSFARPAVPKCDTVDLNEIIKNTIGVVGVETGNNNVTIEERLDCNLPMLRLDENQIRRVLINLIRNATEAMPGGGTITISTVSEGQWVGVDIADTGIGISEKDADKLFDAFFTSKSTGSGLGLTISAQIVSNHGGSIEAQRREPAGSIFTIKLPVKAPS